jgi:hypothetical protein
LQLQYRASSEAQLELQLIAEVAAKKLTSSGLLGLARASNKHLMQSAKPSLATIINGVTGLAALTSAPT